MQIVFLRLAVGRVELDRAGDRGVAARRPVVAGVEPHRLEHILRIQMSNRSPVTRSMIEPTIGKLRLV